MAKRKSGPVVYSAAGQNYRGEYVVFGTVLTVTWQGKQRTADISGAKERPDTLARNVLGEMVRAGR